MQDGWKAVWRIPYVSVAFLPSLKENFIAYRSSKVSSRPDCIFEIHQQWQSGFSRVYSNCCCSCWFEPEIIKIGQSSHKMYSNNILNFKCLSKKIWKRIECTTYTRVSQKNFIILVMWNTIWQLRMSLIRSWWWQPTLDYVSPSLPARYSLSATQRICPYGLEHGLTHLVRSSWFLQSEKTFLELFTVLWSTVPSFLFE